MSDIKVIDELTGKEQEGQKDPEPSGSEVVATNEMLTNSVAEMFDLKPSEIGKYESKINTLIAYAKANAEDGKPENIKWAIRALSLKLGTPPLGEKLINYLTRYAHLAQEKNNIEKEIKKYEQHD